MTLRRRIVVGVSLIAAACLGVAALTVHGVVQSQLTSAIDHDLHGDMDAFATAVRQGGDPARAARRYIASQPFRATTRLLYAVTATGLPITNAASLLDTDDRSLFETPPGLRTIGVSDVGALRLYVVRSGPVTLGVGEPEETVHRALRGVDRGLLYAALLALGVGVLAGTGLGIGVTRSLVRLAAIARRVDAGELSPRAPTGGPDDEVRQLAEAFNTMLDRIEDAFSRQRLFLAEASHELRTPLTVIRGQLEVLAAEAHPDREEVARVERMVTGEVDHMSRLVDDLLAVVAPAVAVERVELAPLLRDLVAGMRAITDKRIDCACDADLAAEADPARLGQAVRNLLANAIEHSATRVAIAAHAARGRVTITVDDDGPGIPVAERERVFDRFHRVDPSPQSKGSGLGLAIVRAFVDAQGGTVRAEQAPVLRGARIRIELPAA